MRGRSRVSFVLFVGVLTVLAGSVTVLALGFFRGGSVVIEVEEAGRGGCDFSMRVPAAAIHAAMLFVPDALLCDVADDVHCRMPMARAFCRDLERLPDFALVEVEGPDERVSVSKSKGALRIHVSTPDERVRVEIPIHLVDTVIGKVERATRDGCTHHGRGHGRDRRGRFLDTAAL